MKPFVAHCRSWTERNSDEMSESLAQIREGCENVMTALMRNAPQVMGDSSDAMLQHFLKKKDYSTLCKRVGQLHENSSCIQFCKNLASVALLHFIAAERTLFDQL